MTVERFDDVARGLASGASRRSLVRVLGAALGVGALAVTSRGADAAPYWDPDSINGDPDRDRDQDQEKTCRPRCQRRCRRERQRCIVRTGNPFQCKRNCDARCCD